MRNALLPVAILVAATSLAQTPEPVVYVRVPVGDALYDDDSASLAQFHALLSQARLREVQKNPAESINEVIAREYKFGHTRTPRAYALIEQAVKNLNDHIHTDKILLPDIAPRALEDFNPKKPANEIPKIAAWRPEQATIINGDTVFRGRPQIIDSGRKASQSMVIEYPVSVAQAKKWKADPSFVGEVLNFPMTALLAADTANSNPPFRVLSDTQAKAVKDALATPKHDSYIVIADSGWPSDTEYQYSVNLLTQMINVVRSDLLNLTTPVVLSMPPHLVKGPQNTHCIAIRDALREFEDLDMADHVKVAYMPLTREQGAAPLLQALIATTYLVDLRIKKPSIVKPGPEELKQADDFAKTVVDRLPPEWPAMQQQVQTDKVLLEAAIRVLNWFVGPNPPLSKRASDTTVFFNESWTVKHEEYFFAPPSPLRGAVIAATGNNNEKINIDLWEFSQRCIANKDTIAVMNYDATGTLICKSGAIDQNYVDSALAVGFDGRVASDCLGGGTSISAPRVAWLLAAGEAVRVKRFDSGQWGLDALNALIAVRSEPSTLKGLLFDPVKFLMLAQKP